MRSLQGLLPYCLCDNIMISSCVPKQEDSGSDLWFEMTVGRIDACVAVNNEDGASQDLAHVTVRDLFWTLTQRFEVSMVYACAPKQPFTD